MGDGIRTISSACVVALFHLLGCSSDDGASTDGASTGAGGSTASGGQQSSSGGTTATGGANNAGTSSGTGGSAPVDPVPTSGCNAATWPESGPYTMDIDGTAREYIVTLPEGYDGTQPLRLMFVFHGLGGTMESVANGFWGYYGLEGVSDGSAIFVAGQGLASTAEGTDYAWRNTDGQDTAFARAMIERFSSEYCIDAERIFVTGMSYGGVMTNDTGCDVGDLVRAIAPIAGAGPGFGSFGGGGPTCVGQVASLLIHGQIDETVPIESGESSRDHWLEANGCGTETSPVDPTQYCVAYSGCQPDHPVTWCVHEGGHTIPDFSAQTIWDFFMQF